MTTVVPADGLILERVLDLHHRLRWTHGLTRHSYGRLEIAQSKTAWGGRRRQRVALLDDDTNVLASATRYHVAGVLDQCPVRVCAIGEVIADARHGADDRARSLIEWLVADGTQGGADVALLFSDADSLGRLPDGFEPIPSPQVTLDVAQSPRHGAPMALIRGGEARDYQAIVAMGQVRAAPFRFHLDRDIDLLEYAIINKRLLAGLAPEGTRQLHFFIAEEGITAAAYVIISVAAGAWTIEECGDRDPSGARLGAMLQALIAREPAERRPLIQGWLPPGFIPPQVTILSAQSSVHIGIRPLGSVATRLGLSAGDVLYWPGDIPQRPEISDVHG
jgi:hypothetical protein